MTDEKPAVFREWAILELLGHRKLGGLVTEQQLAGAALLRIDVYLPDAERPVATQLYAPGALYCLTPCDEATARAFALGHVPEPVTRWELPQPTRQEDDDDDREPPY